MLRVVVRHFHDGNDRDRAARGGALYATRARIWDTEARKYVTSDSGEVFESWAHCNPIDVVSRKAGRIRAVGRIFSLAKSLGAQIPEWWLKDTGAI